MSCLQCVILEILCSVIYRQNGHSMYTGYLNICAFKVKLMTIMTQKYMKLKISLAQIRLVLKLNTAQDPDPKILRNKSQC